MTAPHQIPELRNLDSFIERLERSLNGERNKHVKKNVRSEIARAELRRQSLLNPSTPQPLTHS